tara:strand:- start:502 stop:1086 length:585 start_codon:yes stop_codon:yes gene_type:complete
MQKKYCYISADEEKALVIKTLKGSSSAFTPLFHKYKAIFFHNIKKQYPNYYETEEIQDMAMEFLGRISTKLDLYNPEKAQFSTWITNSMKNFTIEYYHRKKGKPIKGKPIEDIKQTLIASESTSKYMERKGYQKLIKIMKDSLGEEDTHIFEEFFVKGVSKKELAKEMGLNRTTLDYRTNRLKRRLDKFKPSGF